jgi:hypothetical protein
MRMRKVVTPGYRHSVYSNGSDIGIFMSTYCSVSLSSPTAVIP